MTWNDYADYKRSCITWAIIVAIIFGVLFGGIGFGTLGGGVFGVIYIFYGVISGFMGGFAFGGALYVSKFGKPMTFVSKLVMFFICFVLSPIFLIFRILDLKKVKKQLIAEDR